VKWLRLFSTLALLGGAIFLAPVLEHRPADLHLVDETGRDTLCAPSFARIEHPERDRLVWNALLLDLAYATADAGPQGCAVLLGAAAFCALVLGLWCGGLRCGLRRVVVTLALGVPLCVGLVHASCFLPGRSIRLGPEAGAFVPASLHAQSNHSTGFLSPRDLWRWHYARGFRVLNVSDRNTTEGALRTVEEGRARAEPPMLVLVGTEWTGDPDLVLVHVNRRHDPSLPFAKVVAEVEREGGCSFVAHPWSDHSRPLDEVLSAGVAGAELVNAHVHGGAAVTETCRRLGKAQLGVLDYKYGPHVTALTLLPAHAAGSAGGVVDAIRRQLTRILYAVPGGTLSSASYGAGMLESSGAWAGLRWLLETRRARRGVWFVTLAMLALLWRVGARMRPGRAIGVRAARALFVVSAILLAATMAGLSWQVRERFGPIPVEFVLGAATLLAIPLLAATIRLAHAEES